MGPLLTRVRNPLHRDLGPSSDGSNERGGLCACTTRDARALGVLVRVDGRDAADGRLGVRLAGHTAFVGLAVGGDFYFRKEVSSSGEFKERGTYGRCSRGRWRWRRAQ
jgi:hypothetical protein